MEQQNLTTMEKDELLAIRPQDYLAGGFFERGSLREGINGFYSLAMAYRLQEEGGKAIQLRTSVTDPLTAVFETNADRADANRDETMSAEALGAVRGLAGSSAVAASPALSEIFAVSMPLIRDWKSLSALVLHVQRITEQLAVIEAVQQVKR